MKTRLITAVLLAFGIAGLTACANTDTETTSPNNDGEIASSGMALSSQIATDTDVNRIRFRVRPANCSTGSPTGPAMVKTKSLEDMMLPGGIAKFEDAPFDADSKHVFADAFFLVDAGCYNVRTIPLPRSSNCAPANRRRVSVEDGQTTEILLINQCEGVDRGGLDVISAINHPPVLQDLQFQKFRSSCRPQNQEVCATASDPDDDPLEFEWSITGAGQFSGDIVEVSSRQLTNGNWRSCAQVATNRIGDYEFKVTVYDLDGQGNRMEEVLAQQGDPAQSRDDLTFPVYSGVDCQGRRATILMAIGDRKSLVGNNDFRQARRLIRQTARWASPLSQKRKTDVLYVLDDNNKGEHLGPGERDKRTVTTVLDNNFNNLDTMDEPNNGLRRRHVRGYDLVWFANPGFPMDDRRSVRVLRRFNQNGGGVIMEGDDMSRGTFGENPLRYFTGMNFLNNGATTCGVTTNNYSGNPYRVRFSQEPLSAIQGLRGSQMRYDNDIDHVRPLLRGEIILATARFNRPGCSGYRGPAVTAITGLQQP